MSSDIISIHNSNYNVTLGVNDFSPKEADTRKAQAVAGCLRPVGGKFGEAPLVLRGLNSQDKAEKLELREKKGADWSELRIDWLTLSFDDKYLDDILNILMSYYGDYAKSRPRTFYNTAYAFNLHSVSVLFNDYSQDFIEDMKGRFTITLSGSAIGFLGIDLFMRLASELMQFSPTCSRVDYAFDDFYRVVEVEDIAKVSKLGDVKGFRKVNYLEPTDRGVITGKQVSLGRRGSRGNGKYMRIYDKLLESNGEMDCIRYEVEFSLKYSQLAWSQIILFCAMNDSKLLTQHIGEFLGGAVDFIHREHGVKNLDRLKQYGWWSEIISRIGTAELSFRSSPNKELAEMARNRKKQYNPILAAEYIALGKAKFFEMLEEDLKDGHLRLQEKHNQAIHRARDVAGLPIGDLVFKHPKVSELIIEDIFLKENF